MAAAAAAAARISVALTDLGKQLLKDDDDDGDFVSDLLDQTLRPWQRTFSSSVIYGIHQMNEDWSFLSMLCESIHQWMWMDGEGGCFLKLLAAKIEAVADEIAQDVEDKKQLLKNEYRESEFLELVSNYQTETRRLMVEIREDVENLSAGCSFQVHSPPLPHPPPGDDTFTFWTSFVDSVLSNLEFIKWSTIDSNVDSCSVVGAQFYALYKEVELIRDYNVGVCSGGIDFPAVARGDDGDATAIDDFVNHVAYMIVSTAIQSCNFWFHYKTTTTTTTATTTTTESPIEEGKDTRLAELVAEDLQHKIDPINPKFMELHFRFLVALSNIGRYQGGGDFVHHFCTYVFKSRQGDVRNEVSSLLTCFIDNMLHEEEEVVQSFCQEINAVLLWMASLFEAVRKEEVKIFHHNSLSSNTFSMIISLLDADFKEEEKKEEVYVPPCSELLIEICLLKVELSLKKIFHHNSLSSLTFFMISAEKNQNEDGFKQILENMRRYSGDIPNEKMEHGKRPWKSLNKCAPRLHLFVSPLKPRRSQNLC